MPRPPALVFDLDGTLVDSERDIAAALNVALSRLSREPLALEVVLPMIGDGARALVARALLPDPHPRPHPRSHSRPSPRPGVEAPGAPPELVAQGVALFEEAYAAAPCKDTVLLKGAREALDAAAELGVPCAMVTNKPRRIVTLILDALGLTPIFRAIHAGGDGPLKPDPSGILATLRALGVPVAVSGARPWMIGDGPQDVLAGRAAGCVTISVPGIAARESVLAAGPDLVVASLLEVADLLHRALPFPS